MTTANVSCPLALLPTTIAAWRDGALSADESARIAAHIAGCVACQREMAMYESLDNALRRQSVPASDGRLWRAVRAGMTSNRRPRNSGRTVRRMVGATSALAAVLLLALGFAQLFQLRGNVTYHPASTATAQGTPTPLPTAGPATPAVRAASPNWQSANFPTSGITFGDKSDDILTFGVAATDGATAYACYSTTNQTGSLLRMYRTSDRAIHWTQLTQFPLPNVQTSDCEVQVDTLDANRVFVNVLGQNTQTLLGISLNELTEDGGATWTKISYDDTNNPALFYDATSVGGRTYALYQQNGNGSQATYTRHLSVSTDHLRSWQSIDSSLVALGKSVSQFWVRPDGELLAEVSTMAKNSIGILMPVDQSLWISHDGGAHWASFAVPLPAHEALIPGVGFLVQLPIGNAPWRICASYSAPGNRSQVDGIVCTFDGGQSWSVRPILCTNAPCSASSPSSGNDTSLWALTADNSILLISPDSASHLGLYRLPPDSSQWQYLGPMTGGIFYIASAHGGVLWQFAGGVYVGGFFSGNIGGHLGSLPSVLLSTASYP